MTTQVRISPFGHKVVVTKQDFVNGKWTEDTADELDPSKETIMSVWKGRRMIIEEVHDDTE